MTTATTDTRRRVKLYALNAERQWDDRGTGHVSSNYVDRLKGISLLVRAESDGSLLLESKIQPDTAYQKQQDTLIVWSEGDNFDLALSFQEKAGCDEIWEKICQVQGKDPSVEITQDIVEESEDERFEEMSDTAPPIELPPCELARLEDISETIQNCITTPMRKEKLAMALENENYIKKLLNLFHVCEDLENTEGLHHLFEIFKNIFLLNKNALFEIMFADDTIFDVVGCLEYDPTTPQPKKHRQYLKQWAKFREAVPIKNQDLLAKIHQTFRVQYIQDIILPAPSVFVEDNMLNTLSSFIFFNKVEIVTLIQEDERFLVDMFTLLTDPTTTDAKRRDIVLFLKEFCNYAQNLQPQGKDSFYKTLTCLGILQALEITLVMDDQKTKSASIDILTAIVEFSPLVVRNYTLQQVTRTEGGKMLLNIAIEQMLTDSEPELGVAVQLMGIIKILLEPENMLTEKGDFLNFFYKFSIQTLIAPLMLNTAGDRPQNEDYQTAQLLGIVLDILSFCVEHHTYHIKNFIIQKDLLKRILVLMKSTHTFLVLGALRLLRKIIALKDEFYNRHIVKSNLFAPVVDAFIRNNGRYNLLESAILELFEFVKLEDIKTLCVYFVENFCKIFDDVEYVQTFKYLKNRYDQYQDRLKDRDKMSLDNSIPILRGGGGGGGRFRRDARQMEEEEEMWFNEEEDFAEEMDTYNNVMKINDKNGPHQKSPPHQNSPPQNSASSGLITNNNSSSSSGSSSSSNSSTSNLTPTGTTPQSSANSSTSSMSPTDDLAYKKEYDNEKQRAIEYQQQQAQAQAVTLSADDLAYKREYDNEKQRVIEYQQQQAQAVTLSTDELAYKREYDNEKQRVIEYQQQQAQAAAATAAAALTQRGVAIAAAAAANIALQQQQQQRGQQQHPLHAFQQQQQLKTVNSTLAAAAVAAAAAGIGSTATTTTTIPATATNPNHSDGDAATPTQIQPEIAELQQQLAVVEQQHQQQNNSDANLKASTATGTSDGSSADDAPSVTLPDSAVAAAASQLLTSIASAMVATCGNAIASNAAVTNSPLAVATPAEASAVLAVSDKKNSSSNNSSSSSSSPNSSCPGSDNSSSSNSNSSSNCSTDIAQNDAENQQPQQQLELKNKSDSAAEDTLDTTTTTTTTTSSSTVKPAEENVAKKGLVDYESDSGDDDEYDDDDYNGAPSEKKLRLA